MQSPQFTNLHPYSEYSIIDGMVHIDDVVKAAAKDTQPALAITDLANLFGVIKVCLAARGQGIEPIADCDANAVCGRVCNQSVVRFRRKRQRQANVQQFHRYYQNRFAIDCHMDATSVHSIPVWTLSHIRVVR